MFSRFAPALRLAVATARPAAPVRCMSDHVPEGHMTPAELVKYTGADFDNLPVPAGSWQENYDKYQKKFHIQLASATLLVIGTWLIMEKWHVNVFHSSSNYKKMKIDPSKPPLTRDQWHE